MNNLAKIARSLPQAQPVYIPFATYKAVVRESLSHHECRLCHVCGEPMWKHSPHRCFQVQLYYTTIDVESELRMDGGSHERRT